MLVKNLTPFFHGAVLTSRRGRQAELSLAVRGTFRLVHGGVVEAIEGLDQGLMSGDVFGEDDPEQRGELLHPSDFADHKPAADVLFVGSCHAPGGRPVKQLAATFAVGTLRKDLTVFGDRRWDLRGPVARIGEPAPFSSMPLGFRQAFGGPEDANNPVGKGREGAVLPNVELPAELIRSRGDAPRPATFAPVSPRWSPRAEKVGQRYDRRWLAERAPYPPEDFDWRHFQAAPADQQIEGYLRGDEKILLRNLHPEHPELETRLPALRLRAFLKDDQGAFREISMVLDTVLVEGDLGTVKLTWRGLAPVREDDFEDVTHLLVASEPLASAPRPEAEYREVLRAFEADPTGAIAGLPDGMIEAGEREEKRRRGEPVPEVDVPPGLDPVSRELKSRFGKLLSDEQLAETRAQIAQLQSALPKDAPPVDLEKAVSDARAAERKDPPLARVQRPGRLPDVRLRARMRKVQEEVARLRALEKQSGQRLDGIEPLEALPSDPRWKQLDPEYEVPGPLSTDAPGPGADLRERDLAEQDLSGADLSGADLRMANLAYAKLRGAKLRGAKLGRAILYGADLSDADLSGADLTLVNAALARAPRADLTRAVLTEAFFEDAVLAGARLDESTAEYAIFARADLSGASARRARLDRADLAEAKLEGADLTEASAVLALLAGVKAAGLRLAGAHVHQASFAEADLTGANLVGAQASKALFDRARLDGADLSFSNMASCHLTSVRAFRARFHGADLREARGYRADLAHADMTHANLLSADLRKAHLEGTRLGRANLYDAKLLDVRGKGFDLTDANLKRVVWEQAR